jgi:hypothetical protein
MEDQVQQLGNLGISAIAIGDNDDSEMIQQVINGNFLGGQHGLWGTIYEYKMLTLR